MSDYERDYERKYGPDSNHARMGAALEHAQAAIAEIEKAKRNPDPDYPLASSVAAAADRLRDLAFEVERAQWDRQDREKEGGGG